MSKVTTLILSLLLSTLAQDNTFTWDFVGSSTLPECGTSTIKIINSRANGSPGSATGPFTMLSYQPGGTTVSSALVGSDTSNLQWVVPHSAGSQVFLQVADSSRNTGGIAGSLFSVTSGASTTCHGGVASSLRITTTSTALRTCDPLILDFSGGSKPYTISIVAQNSNVVTNVTMGPNDNEFTYINRAPPNAPLIVAARDSSGQWGQNTNLINLSGPTDTFCNGAHSLSGVKGASVSSTLPAPGDAASTPSINSPASQAASNSGGGGNGGSNNPSANSVAPQASPSNDVNGGTATVSVTSPLITITPGVTAGVPPNNGASSNSGPTATSSAGGGGNDPMVDLPVNNRHINVGAIAGGIAAAAILIISFVVCFIVMYYRKKRNEELEDYSLRGSRTLKNTTRGTGMLPSPTMREEQRINPFITPSSYSQPQPQPQISTHFDTKPAPSTKYHRLMMEKQQQSPISPESQYSSPQSQYPSPTSRPFSPTHPYATARFMGDIKTRPPSSAQDSSDGRPTTSGSSNAPLLSNRPISEPHAAQAEYNPYTQPLPVAGGPRASTATASTPVIQHQDGGPLALEVPPPYAAAQRERV